MLKPPTAEAGALAAKTIRILAVDAVAQARHSGHLGLPLGCAELGVVLFSEFLRHDPRAPDWPDRDRFVLSAGHGSMLLYSLLHLSGYGISIDDIRSFRQLGSITPGHPESKLTPGVETTTGPLGQGFANAVGMALAERLLAARFGPELVDHRTYVLASDGDMMEGVAAEAASLAGHLGLGRLIAFYDDNQITIDGPTSLTFSEDVVRRFEAYGWEVQGVDGHDPEAIRRAIRLARETEDRPHLILSRTHIGYGSPVADTKAAHGQLNDELTAQTRETLGWTLPPFEIPDEVRGVFQGAAEQGASLREAWETRKARAIEDPRVAELWRSMVEGSLPADLESLFPDFRGAKPMATRQASGKILNAVAESIPSLVGGSGDLTSSNSTGLDGGALVERAKFDGRYIHYGVREHAMASIANGLALHGGIRPYVGTFLVFSDYMRPALRLAAMMENPVTFVFTHDSIFVGEDGPTHQPVEHLAALRTIPNLAVWRPADARETVAAWRAALAPDAGPTALLLTRQGVPVLEADGVEADAERGGYVLQPESGGSPDLVLVGSGSEVSPLLEVARLLEADGRRVRVVSMPNLACFLAQDADYRERVLPERARRLVVEASVSLGASPLIRPGDRFHGMDRFGASAPYATLAEEFGFTPERIVEIAREVLA
jgi:transketolase